MWPSWQSPPWSPTVFGQGYGGGPYRPIPGLFPGEGLNREDFVGEFEKFYSVVSKKLFSEALEKGLELWKGGGSKIASKVGGKFIDFFANPDPLGEAEESRIRAELEALARNKAAWEAATANWPALWRDAFARAILFPRVDVTMADP